MVLSGAARPTIADVYWPAKRARSKLSPSVVSAPVPTVPSDGGRMDLGKAIALGPQRWENTTA